MKKITIAFIAVISMFAFGCKKNSLVESNKPVPESHSSFSSDPVSAGDVHNDLLSAYLASTNIDNPSFRKQDVLQTLKDVLIIAANKGYIDPSEVNDYSESMFAGMVDLGYFDNDGNLKSENELNAIYPSLADGPLANAIIKNNSSSEVGDEFLNEIKQRIIDLKLDPNTEEAQIAEGYLSVADASYALAIVNLSIIQGQVQLVESAIRRIVQADSNGFDEGWEAGRVRDLNYIQKGIWGATYAVVRSAEQTKRELSKLR